MKYDIESNIASFEISGGKIAYAKEINGTAALNKWYFATDSIKDDTLCFYKNRVSFFEPP